MRTLWHILTDLESTLDNAGTTQRAFDLINEAKDSYQNDDVGSYEISDAAYVVIRLFFLSLAFIAGAIVF